MEIRDLLEASFPGTGEALLSIGCEATATSCFRSSPRTRAW